MTMTMVMMGTTAPEPGSSMVRLGRPSRALQQLGAGEVVGLSSELTDTGLSSNGHYRLSSRSSFFWPLARSINIVFRAVGRGSNCYQWFGSLDSKPGIGLQVIEQVAAVGWGNVVERNCSLEISSPLSLITRAPPTLPRLGSPSQCFPSKRPSPAKLPCPHSDKGCFD